MNKPVVLVVLDGWGEWEVKKGNPIAIAKHPTIDQLNQHYPKLTLEASGPAVGLPWGVYGNSEVGHQTLGSGQIKYQFLPMINMQIESGDFLDNSVLTKLLEKTKKNKARLHLVGLLSDGGVHSHIHHVEAILEAAKKNKIKEVFIHAITDGRDTAPNISPDHIKKAQLFAKRFKIGQIATICGRYYAMDRNNNWDRIEKAYRVMVDGVGIKEKDPLEAIQNQFKQKIFDEMLEPVVITNKHGEPVGKIQSGDSVIIYNYREDRSRQIARALCLPGFQDFDVSNRPKINVACFAEYEEGLPADIIFHPPAITSRLGETLSQNGKQQLRLAETEKFAHVTYFFNGGQEKPFKGEERIIVPSKNVKNYATKPAMSAYELTDKIIENLKRKNHDFILLNFANPDMVGHTGDYQAGIKAIEVVDECLGKVIKTVLKKQGSLIVTADHGNIEEMINIETGEKDTEHSSNPVPCWLVTPDNYREKADFIPQNCDLGCMIADIAPTALAMMGIKPPRDMSGKNLLNYLQ